MSSVPFFRGQNVTLKFFQDGKPVLFLAKGWQVQEEATETQEGVNGEDRDRLDKVTNFYSASCDLYQNDQEQMQSIIDAQTANDAQGLPLRQSASVLIRQRDGGKAAYLMSEVTTGAWSLESGGRADPVMLKFKMRFRYWKPIRTF